MELLRDHTTKIQITSPLTEELTSKWNKGGGDWGAT
jgi:hypothetical protein